MYADKERAKEMMTHRAKMEDEGKSDVCGGLEPIITCEDMTKIINR
jgi:hypothetical protein